MNEIEGFRALPAAATSETALLNARMRALRHEIYLLEGEADQSEQHARVLRDRALTLRSELYALEMVKEATH